MNDDTRFFGQGLSVDTYDELAFSMIRSDWRSIEIELFTTKWFDYRFMHPTVASYLFAHHYKLAARVAYRTNFDVRKGDWAKFLPHQDLFKCSKTTVSGIWRGRQMADGLGIPYDVYLRFAFEERLRYWKQSWMPRPQQLYGDDLVARIMARWEEAQSTKLYTATHPAYLVANDQGLPWQEEHVDWLKRQAHKRSDPKPVLDNFRRKGLLP